MSYIKNSLRPGEVIIFFEEPKKLKPNKINLVLLSLFTIFLYAISPPVAWFIGALLLIGSLSIFFNKVHDEFAVTNRRVIVKDKSSTSEFLLEKIEGCDLLGSTVTIKGSGGTKLDIEKVPSPLSFKNAIYDAIEMLKYPDEFSNWTKSHQKGIDNDDNHLKEA